MDNVNEINGLLAFLKEVNRERFFNTGYDLLLNFRKESLDAPTEVEVKIRTIDNMINFFEAKEEYEKCAYLLDVKKEILELEQVDK
jgi:hypothetical protein